MEKKWYYAIDKKPVGPVDEDEFLQLIENGTILAEMLVWQPGMKEWKPLSDISIPEPSTVDAETEIETEIETENKKEMKAEPEAGSQENKETKHIQDSKTEKEIDTEYETIKDISDISEDVTDICAQCGNKVAGKDMTYEQDHWICASCRSEFSEKSEADAILSRDMVYADFWVRAGAKLIDFAILWAIGIVVTSFLSVFISPTYDPEVPAEFPVLINMFQLIIAVSYTTYFLGTYAATPGKMVCHLRVVTPDGQKISYSQACLRYFAEIISSLIFGIGYLMAIVDVERRTLHDRIAGTRVIKSTQNI